MMRRSYSHRPHQPRQILLYILSALAAVGTLAALALRSTAVPNPTQLENARLGTSDWEISLPATNHQIEGYASAPSVNRGEQITFFVSTNDPTYNIDIYRIGWYSGAGGRLVKSIAGLTGSKQTTPSPDSTSGMVECAWQPAVTVTTSNPSDPSDWVSGIYLAKLTGSSGRQQYIVFALRDDARPSDLIFQQAVNTFQAYNAFGGKSLYDFGSGGKQAFKVSFNRPYRDIASPGGSDDGYGEGLFNKYEIDMVRFLEREDYDVTYFTDVDLHREGSLALSHKAVLVIGQAEYWTWEMRQNATAARDAGINLGFFSANDVYWQVRYEPSPITGAPNRTIVAYKENASKDPDASNPATYYLITTRWRDPHSTLPGDPEDSLTGVMYNEFEPVADDVQIGDTSSFIFANTGLHPGDRLKGLLGPEVDRAYPTAPPGMIVLAHSPYIFSDGSTQISDMSIYTAPSGALVFTTGTQQWSWGVDGYYAQVTPIPAAQQITRNVLARFINGATPTPSPTPTKTATQVPTVTVTASAGPTSTPAATASAVSSTTATGTFAAPTPTPAAVTIGLRSVSTGSTSMTGSSVTISQPSLVQGDDVMLAQIGVRGGTATTITPPAGWVLVRRDNNSSVITQALYAHVVTSPGGEPASYTWNFTNGNDAAGGIADYSGVNTATPIDVSAGIANASSQSITAPSLTVPGGDNSDRLVGMFAIPNSSAVTGPNGMTQRWGFHAISGGIGVEMSDLALTNSGATGSKVATAGTAGANIGALVALLPANVGSTPTPTSTPTVTASPIPSLAPTGTPGPTPVSTQTATPTSSASASQAPTPTATGTFAAPTPTPAAVTIGLRSVSTGSTSMTGSSVTISQPSLVQGDDVMLAQIGVRGGTATTITPPAGWVLVRRDNNSSVITQALYAHVVTSPGGEPASYTWNFTNGNDAAGGIADYSGVNTATPIDVSAGIANASSQSITAPSLTVPGGDNSDRLVGMFAIPNSSAVTGPNGMTQRWGFHAISGGIGVEMSDLALTNSGATGSKVATAGTAGANIGALVALLPAPGGPQ